MVKNVSELNAKNFDEFVRKESKVVVDFWAEWCGPCSMMKPIFEGAAAEMKDKAAFGKVDVDDNSKIAQRFNVMSIPTLIFFKDGEQVDRVIGAISKAELVKRIREI